MSTWKKVQIGSVADVNPSLPRVPLPEEQVSFVSMSDLGEGRILGKQIRLAREVRNGFTQFADGDILVAKITPCFENGKGCLCEGLHNGLGYGSTEFIVLRPKNGIYDLFLYYHTISAAFRRAGAASMVGSAGQKRLQPGFVRTYAVDLPPILEQRAIANILLLWDRAIEQLGALVEAKLRFKHGVVQQLSTGKRRFSEFNGAELKDARLVEVLKKVATPVKVDPNRMYQEIGIRSHGKGIFHKEPVSGRSLGNKRVYPVVPGCLTLNIVFAWERALAVTTEREAGMIASHRFPMFQPDPKRLLPKYALHYLLSQKGTEALNLASPGGAGRNRTLSQTELLREIIPLPTIAEQRRIIDLVETSDREIDQLKMQLEKLEAQKTGLMQKLLTGRVRVKP